MLANILWGVFFLILITFMIFLDRRRKKRKYHKPYKEKTEQEKEIEKQIVIEKEKSRGGYPWIQGFRFTLYYGRFVQVCDLVTDERIRSFKRLWRKASFVCTRLGQGKHGYESVALSSGLQRIDAHRFYEKKMNYNKVSYVFKRNL